MPGAGSHPAGSAPAGYDPVDTVATLPNLLAGVPYFELATRSFPFNDDGSLAMIHPVDQAVEIALGVQKGTITSAPDVGVDWVTLKAASYAQAPKLAPKILQSALQRLIDAGDVDLRAVRYSRPSQGRNIIEVDYVNLRLPTRTVKTVGRSV